MRNLRWLLAALLVPALVLGWAGNVLAQTPGTPAADEAPPPTVFVRQDPELGPILTDPAGMTLYLFTNDTVEGESACYDKCVENWPLFTVEEPLTLPEGVDGELTTVERTDGTTQIAYNGIPLYYWAKDTAPGQTTGHGVGDVWFVVAPGQQFGEQAPGPVASPDAAMGTPAAAGEVTVSLTEFTIESSATTFKVGEAYTFNVTNTGQFPHEFYIEAAGALGEPLEGDGGEAEIEPMDGGASGTLEFTFSEPGTYQLACHVRGHYGQGMALTIHVTE